jgi:Fe-S cluster assembly ATPase SufC
VNVSKSSDPERLNNICVANVSDQATYIVKHGSIHMNDQEFSDIETFERLRKGILVFMLMLCY